MRKEDLLEQCLLALRTGQELSPEAARYLARHPEERARIEDLLSVAQRTSRFPSVELSTQARQRMQSRLAERLGFDASVLDAPALPNHSADTESMHSSAKANKPLLSLGRLSVSRLRYGPPAHRPGPLADASTREVFRDLTPDDIRRYIGVRGEDYLRYRRKFPGWRPVFAFLAILLRGFKRLERLVTVESR